MEFLLFVGVVVLIWWAWSSRKASQLNLRYQAHKDALEEARRLLTKYDWKKPTKYQRLAALPIELREEADDRLENIACHVDTTVVPAGLGDEQRLRELLEDVTVLSKIDSGNIPATGLAYFRGRFYDQTFDHVREMCEMLEQSEPPLLLESMLDSLRSAIKDGKTALKWYEDDGSTSERKHRRRDAKLLLVRARTAIERWNPAAVEQELEREASQE